MKHEHQLRLLAFLQHHERAATTFRMEDAAAVAGLKPSSIATYFSKKLAPRHLTKGKDGSLHARGFVGMPQPDFLAMMSQKTPDVLPLFAYATQQAAQPPHTDIQPIYFAALTLKGVSLEAAVTHYLDWIEGVGDFLQTAGAQRAKGVPEGFDRAALLRGEPVACGQDCEIAGRSDNQEVLLRFIHPAPEAAGVTWWTVVRLTGHPRGIRIEHAVGREAKDGVATDPSTGLPKVLRSLLDRPGVGAAERDVAEFTPRVADFGSAAAYVQHDLTDPDRVLPHLVVSPPRNGRVLVRPEQLAKLLGTQVVVVRLTEGASPEFGKALARLDYPPEVTALEPGGMRLFQPDLRTNRRTGAHPTWTAEQLARLVAAHGPKAAQRVAGLVAEKVVWRALPARFFLQVEEWDRRRRSQATDVLLHATTAKVASAQATIEGQAKEISTLKLALEAVEADKTALATERDSWFAELQRVRQEKEELSALLDTAEAERDLASRERDESSREAFKANARLDSLQQARTSTGDDITLSKGHRDGLAAILRPGDLPHALSLIETLYPDRVIVLDSATASARESVSFRFADKAFELLATLATGYWQRMQDGGGDATARECFGHDRYAAQESESVMHRERPRALRTFRYNGQDVTMWRHLKIGVKDSLAETWRCHFDYDAAIGKVVIGHCGKHLDHV